MSNFKKLGKGFVAAIVLSTISVFAFLLYMLLIGIPKTQARNYYNLAEEVAATPYLADTDSTESKHAQIRSYLERALEFWPEQYIKDRLEDFSFKGFDN